MSDDHIREFVAATEHGREPSAAEIELYGRGTKIVPEGLECLCCYLPRCDRVPHCQALIQPSVVLAAVQQWVARSPAAH